MLLSTKSITKKDISMPSLNKKLLYIIPCYNESQKELQCTIDSLVNQKYIDNCVKLLVIVCDGKVTGIGEELSTDQILLKILKENIQHQLTIKNAYINWNNEQVDLDVCSGIYNRMPFICMIKNINVGKRDSLVLVRSLTFAYNNNELNLSKFKLNDQILEMFNQFSNINNIQHYDYIIGTDADTVFDKYCSYNLVKKAEDNPDTVGVCGFVKISPECNKWSPWVLYQNAEYTSAQCLRRLEQSEITNKVSCLPGCVQLLKVCNETCGNDILDLFNYKPSNKDNIIKQITSYASEDRNHVCLMLSKYPKIKTMQTLDAIAYTKVPMNLSVFLSQRKRWSLGATVNDIFLTTAPGIHPFERFIAIANVITYFFCTYIFAATGFLLYAIIMNYSILIVYLSIPMFIPLLYCILIPIWLKSDDNLNYIIGYLLYFIIGMFVNVFVHIYSIWNMDSFNWGKTREVKETKMTETEMTEIKIV
jgi:chitin synthase